MSIVRDNIMNVSGYVPYCGATSCKFRMPRTQFNGKQFECICGWQSSYEKEFIDEYKKGIDKLALKD